MKPNRIFQKSLNLSFVLIAGTLNSFAQSDALSPEPVEIAKDSVIVQQHTTTDSLHSGEQAIAEQIKLERDKQLKDLSEKLKKNEDEVARLTDRLSNIDERK